MGRNKKKKADYTATKTRRFWDKATKDGKTKSGKDEPFAQIYASLWRHPRYLALHPRTQQLYDRMILECNGHREFQFTRSTAAKYGFRSSSVLRKAIAELVDAGFIEITSSGQNTRTATDYQFSMEWKTQPLDVCSLSIDAAKRQAWTDGQPKDVSESKTE